MIQPIAKLLFVERYCRPADGWSVFVDIDPSEEGRTGSARQSEQARARLELMRLDAPRAVRDLVGMGAYVGKRKAQWGVCFGRTLPLPPGDRDIIAVHRDRKQLWIVEVEGDSSGQPEGKIYRAIGQLVCALSEVVVPGLERRLSLVVAGDSAGKYLARVRAIAALGISGLVVQEDSQQDRWLFGEAPTNLALHPTEGSRCSSPGR
jgi:hypothetical protein